jgi:hypothetical protein
MFPVTLLGLAHLLAIFWKIGDVLACGGGSTNTRMPYEWHIQVVGFSGICHRTIAGHFSTNGRSEWACPHFLIAFRR